MTNSHDSTHHPAGPHGHSALGHLIHHAAVAAVLALLVVVLETHGWLNWLDTASLRVALAWKNSASQLFASAPVQGPVGSGAPPASSPGPRIRPVQISDEAFELRFYQESPLSRVVLLELLERAVARQPSVIAVDIDLSPGPRGARSNLGQDELNAALARIAAAGRPRLVLVTPFPVSDDAVLEAKYAWMRSLCQAGAHFAYPDIPISQGLALRVDPELHSMGRVTSAVIQSDARRFEDEPCALVRQGPEKAYFLSTLAEGASQARASELASMLPLNPNAVDQMIAASVLWSGRADDSLSGVQPGEAVMIGASYDPRDTLLTLSGRQPGMLYHAASALTLGSPSRKVGHAGAFAFDLVLGVLAGYLFGWGWQRYNRAAGALDHGSGPVWRRYLYARGWLVGNLLLLLAWLLLIFSLSAVLLKAQIWASPGAMVLGVFVKTLLASRSQTDAVTATASARPAGRFAIVADLCVGAPLLIYGIYLTFFAH